MQAAVHDATLDGPSSLRRNAAGRVVSRGGPETDCVYTTIQALNTAIFGLAGDHVITTVCEHNSVLRPLYALEKQGLELS